MKKIFSLMILVAMTAGIFSCTGNSTTAATGTPVVAGKKVVVYYFHFTRRCMTCQNVENVSKKAVETLYPEKNKAGEITFQSLNLEEKEGEAVGKKFNIEGQTLVVISGDKKVDLTDKAFTYANNSPEKLTAEIKKTVDGLLR
jgi:hypothetical protein